MDAFKSTYVLHASGALNSTKVTRSRKSEGRINVWAGFRLHCSGSNPTLEAERIGDACKQPPSEEDVIQD